MRQTTLKILFFLALIYIATGCGGGGRVRAQFPSGPMPAGGSFDGVYQSDFGRMELTVSGDDVVGLYEDDQHYGRIEGKVRGQLLSFKWTQWNEDMQGKMRPSTGRGVFMYILDEVNVGETVKQEHKLEGTWGYGDSEGPNKWNAWKLTRSKKRLKPYDPNAGSMDRPKEDQGGSAGFDSTAPSSGSSGGSDSYQQQQQDNDQGGGLDDIF